MIIIENKNLIFTILIVILSFAVIVIVTSLLNIYILRISSSSSFRLFAFLIDMLIDGIFCLYIIPYLLSRPDEKITVSHYLTTIKIPLRTPKIKSLLLGISSAVLILLGTFIYSILLGRSSLNLEMIFGCPSSNRSGYFTFIYNIVPALWEEIVFRGVILVLLLKKCEPKVAILIDGILFGCFHFINLAYGANFFSTVGQVAFTTFFGITLAYLFIKTRSLIPCIIAHYVSNAFQPLVSHNIPLSLYFFIIFIVLLPMILSILLIKCTLRTDEIISKSS